MKNFNHPRPKIKSKLCALVSVKSIKKLSVSSGFLSRAARKISAIDFVMSFFLCCANRKATLSSWVSQMCILNGGKGKQSLPSRQGIWNRFSEASSTFAEALLTKLLSSKINTLVQKRSLNKSKGILRFFPRVLIQDSTTISLPRSLSQFFKGNVADGVTKAVARIQCVLDIRTMRFAHFQLGSFCDNDQGAASLIHHLVSKGTLVMRDLGYFVLGSIKEIIRQQGYFLSRLKYGPLLYDAPNGKKLPLTTLLKASVRPTSRNVLIGRECRLPVRLIILPLSAQVAAERRRRARVDRDKRLNHSKDYMLALGYQILLTNVGEDMWTAEQAAEAYRLRWGIECMFKGFKSAGLHINRLCDGIRTNAERVRSTLLLALCFIVVQAITIYQLFSKSPCKNRPASEERTMARRATSIYLSMNRMIDWICSNYILWVISPPHMQREYLRMSCSYEIRKDRINMAKHLEIAMS
jgi:hypothetical protein